MERDGIGVGEQVLGVSGVCLGRERRRIWQVCVNDPVVAEEHQEMREGEEDARGRSGWLRSYASKMTGGK